MRTAVSPSAGVIASSNAERMVALDGLRGIAVIFVLLEHFTYSEWVRAWSPGAVGVKTFFVLSGFLITSILLDLRDSSISYSAARYFFARRMRRLLPALLVAILVGSALGVGGLPQDWFWHMTYMSNLQVWWQSSWSGAGHFWTLALEQQFYLLWFPAVMIMPRRWLAPLVLGLLVCAPIFRSAISFGASSYIDVLLPAQADALAAGALLSLAIRGDIPLPFVSRLTMPVILWGLIGLLFLILSLPALGQPRSDLVQWVLTPSLIAFAALAIVATAVTQPQRLALLTAPVLVWIGTISYGIYIYHYFVPQFFILYIPSLAEAETVTEKSVRLLAWLIVSVALAAVSWHIVEKPFLKKRE